MARMREYFPHPLGAEGNLEMAYLQSFPHKTITNFVLTESLFKAFNSSSSESFSFIISFIPKKKKKNRDSQLASQGMKLTHQTHKTSSL